MLIVENSKNFLSVIAKIKDAAEKERIKKLVKKITEFPEIDKPMRYSRQGTRELYAGSFRLSYAYLREENKLIFLDVYHKEKQ